MTFINTQPIVHINSWQPIVYYVRLFLDNICYRVVQSFTTICCVLYTTWCSASYHRNKYCSFQLLNKVNNVILINKGTNVNGHHCILRNTASASVASVPLYQSFVFTLVQWYCQLTFTLFINLMGKCVSRVRSWTTLCYVNSSL